MGIALLGTRFPRVPEIKQMEEYFQSDREQLQIIVDYFLHTNFDNITIWGVDNIENVQIEMFTGLETGRVLVSDENVSRAIKDIFMGGYRLVEKNENGVKFLRWSIRNHGRGIVYSIDGSIPDSDTILFLTELHPLSEENWFVFVENFSEYRTGVRPNLP